MSFTNLYYKRTAGTAKACYVCYKPTTTVLATINTVDFLYTCDGHLSDSGFASLVSDTNGISKDPSKAVPSEEIAKVKAEWEEKQKKKQEREKEAAKEKEKDGNDKEKESSKQKEKKVEDSTTPKTPASPTSIPATPSPPAHQRYTLHRDFFTMRQTEHRRRRQAAQAKELAPRLPGAPSGGFSDKF